MTRSIPHNSDDDQMARRELVLDPADVAEQFQKHRARLKKMVQLRMDRRLSTRVDPSDVLQDTWLDCARRRSANHLACATPGERHSAAEAYKPVWWPSAVVRDQRPHLLDTDLRSP